MAKRTVDELIRRAWPIFRNAARTGTTLTYTELATGVGPPLHRRQMHRQLLDTLSERCEAAGLPNLCAMVVRKDTGEPGGGWLLPDPRESFDRARWAEDLAACWNHPWPPKPDPRLLTAPTSTTPKRGSKIRRTVRDTRS